MYSNFTINIKETRSGDRVPVINDIHLHSAYKPVSEAENFAEQKREVLERNSNILIFGLGFGYHIRAIENILKTSHKNYKIKVIEPIKSMQDAFFENGFSIDEDNIQIYQFDTIAQYYNCEELVEFMANKPAVISHPASFKLCTDFYSSFMQHKASKNTSDIEDLVTDQAVKKYLSQNENRDIIELLKDLSNTNRIESAEELLFMTYKEIITTNSTGEL